MPERIAVVTFEECLDEAAAGAVKTETAGMAMAGMGGTAGVAGKSVCTLGSDITDCSSVTAEIMRGCADTGNNPACLALMSSAHFRRARS